MIRTLNKLSRIELYTTSKKHKMRACDVRKRTGADVVINGSLFDYGTWLPLCDVKAKGRVLSDDRYSYRGLACNQRDTHFTVALTGEMNRWDNFISCVFLIHEGKKLQLEVDGAVGRSAARTALFGTWDGRIHIWCDKQPMTPWQLQAQLLRRGNVLWALMLDGGGSTQLSQEGKNYIYSSRRVQNYLCFWESTGEELEPEGGKPMVEINAYSKTKDGDIRLSSHFKVREFACKDGSDAVLVAPRLVMVLESLRTHFGQPVVINSGYRTPQYNEQVGGVAHSQHCYGTAADIKVCGIKPADVSAYARQIMPDWGGVGTYNQQGFTHIDVREKKSDWHG